MFNVYFQVGLRHIADLAAYDHILFIIALCAVYRLKQWRQVLILVTAFTVGHSITLALSALDLVIVNGALIEFLIPLTIFLTALYNVSSWQSGADSEIPGKPTRRAFLRVNEFKYLMALFFGLIHGMGFSNYFKSLLGSEANITLPLFAFNVGIEVGQIIIVLVILSAAFLALDLFKLKQRSWNIFISGAAAGIALTLMIETWPY